MIMSTRMGFWKGGRAEQSGLRRRCDSPTTGLRFPCPGASIFALRLLVPLAAPVRHPEAEAEGIGSHTQSLGVQSRLASFRHQMVARSSSGSCD